MANITFLEAVNRVLVRLRESETTKVTLGTYPQHIAAIVNEAKEEVENAWTWNCNLTTLTITVVTDTSVYSLTDFGDNFSIRLVFDTSNNYYLRGPSTTANLVADSYLSPSTSSGAYSWTIYGKDSNGDPQIKLYPTPSSGSTIDVIAYVQQPYLVNNTDEILVPWRPVVMLAYMKALAERGEDSGTNWAFAQSQYDKALGDAIAFDANNGHVNRDWFCE